MEEIAMKKENFVSLVLGTVGGLAFALGMCICLVPEWNANFTLGVITAAIGAVILVTTLIVHRVMSGKPFGKPNFKALGKVLFGIAGSLVFGTGMCMIMVWGMMIPGILVGIAGIVLLLCLIPMCVGLK